MKIQINILSLHQISSQRSSVLSEIVRYCLYDITTQLSLLHCFVMGFFVWFLSLHRTQVFRRTANKIRVICEETPKDSLSRGYFNESKLEKLIGGLRVFCPFCLLKSKQLLKKAITLVCLKTLLCI